MNAIDTLDVQVNNAFGMDCFSDRVGFHPVVLSFFGRVARKEGVAVYDAAKNHLGWHFEIHFAKQSVVEDGKGPLFYCITTFIPKGVTVRRALELVLNQAKAFVEHELREGLVYDGQRPFAPHGRTT